VDGVYDDVGIFGGTLSDDYTAPTIVGEGREERERIERKYGLCSGSGQV
jgi:hypothetical protein